MPKTLRQRTTAQLRKLTKEHPQILSEINQQLRQTIQRMMEEDRIKTLRNPVNVEALKRATSKLRPGLIFLFLLHRLIQSKEVVDVTLRFESGKSVNLLIDRIREELRAGRYRTIPVYTLLVKDDQDQIVWGSDDIAKERLDNLLFNILLRESPIEISLQGPRIGLQWGSTKEMVQELLESQQRQGLVKKMTSQYRHIRKEDLRQNRDLRQIISFLLG